MSKQLLWEGKALDRECKYRIIGEESKHTRPYGWRYWFEESTRKDALDNDIWMTSGLEFDNEQLMCAFIVGHHGVKK